MKFIKDLLSVVAVIMVIVGLAIAIGYAIGFGWDKGKANLGSGVIVSDPITMTASSTLIANTTDSAWHGSSEVEPMILGTSTERYMTATLTKDIEIGNDVDSFCMNIWFYPSTTNAVLDANFLTSQDGISFYPIDNVNNTATTTNRMFDNGTSSVRLFPSNGVSEVKKKYVCPIQLQNLNTKWLRFEFFRGTGLDGGKLFIEGWTKTKY